MTAVEIVSSYLSFFEKRGHAKIQNSSLVPLNDPTTLFTSSGMQPLLPYLLGESHPSGNRLVNVQNCFRAQDIDEIGDNRHTTFFRMLGNWSLGGYFKSEQLPWFFEFLTKELGLDPKRLYVSVFKGYKNIPKDEESAEIWRELFKKENIDPEGKIFYCGVDDNWWSRSGTPDKMPSGEPGGPDSEVYFDLKPEEGEVSGNFKELSDNGRLLEIGNSVFMEYIKKEDGSFAKLPKSNVDFGGGLERILAAVENQLDIFQTSLYSEAIKSLEAITKTNITYELNPKPYRIIADHLTASIYMVSEGIVPSNKGQGYILRRLIRRAMVQARKLGMEGDEWLSNVSPIIETRTDVDGSLKMDTGEITLVITQEVDRFRKTIGEGLKEMRKMFSRVFGGVDPDNHPGINMSDNKYHIDGKEIFKIYETYGLPIEIAQEIMTDWGLSFDEQTMKEAKEAVTAHQQLSRKGAAQKFAGGLADHEELTVKGHTATHLLHQALRDVLGNSVHQTGSNITSERLRFDFSFDRKLSDEELKKVEEIVHSKIEDNLPVRFEIMNLNDAKKLGAIGLFDEKYGKDVKVYFIGDYSKEFCGGPHVNFTAEIKSFKIIKEEGSGKNTRRIYAKVT